MSFNANSTFDTYALQGEPLELTVRSLNFTLSGPNYQNLRRFVRRCKSSFTAINESNASILDLLLPYALRWPAVLHGLLALSVPPSKRAEKEFSHYQAAISELQNAMKNQQADPSDMEGKLKVLSASFLLSIFGLSQCDDTWVVHSRAMISIIRMTDQHLLAATELGRFLISACSHMDIFAFSIGRTQQSHRAWLAWMVHRTKGTNAYSVLEATLGYPESLISIIALISEAAETNVFMGCLDGNPSTAVKPSNGTTNSAQSTTMVELESLLSSWTPPVIPSTMSPLTNVSLRLAWETIKRAAFLFLWRGSGFHANFLKPIQEDREALRDSYVREIISNVRGILDIAQIQFCSIANAMLWPLAVAGCECSIGTGGWDKELLSLLDALQQSYSMDHISQVKKILQEFWDRKSLHATRVANDDYIPQDYFLSLEQIAREYGLIIPLL